MMKFAVKIFLLMLALLVPITSFALDNSAVVKVTPLLKTTTSWDNKPIIYPEGDAQITGLIVEIAPGGETGWHEHPVPSFGMLLQGTLEITQENGQVKLLQAGEALAEVVNTKHNGKNVGKEPVKIIVFYTGNTETPLTIPHPEMTKPDSEPVSEHY
jgi:quercetin dioxygenase-like cupin family protein